MGTRREVPMWKRLIHERKSGHERQEDKKEIWAKKGYRKKGRRTRKVSEHESNADMSRN